MSDLDITSMLPILSLGLWVGVSMIFVCKMFSWLIGFIIGLFKKAI